MTMWTDIEWYVQQTNKTSCSEQFQLSVKDDGNGQSFHHKI